MIIIKNILNFKKSNKKNNLKKIHLNNKIFTDIFVIKEKTEPVIFFLTYDISNYWLDEFELLLLTYKEGLAHSTKYMYIFKENIITIAHSYILFKYWTKQKEKWSLFVMIRNKTWITVSCRGPQTHWITMKTCLIQLVDETGEVFTS